MHGYPRPQIFVSLDYSTNAGAEPGVAATNVTAAASTGNVRYKVWVVLGPERLELPKTYAGIKEREGVMARKVLRHLRSRNGGEGWSMVGSERSLYPIFLTPSLPSSPFTSFLSPTPHLTTP